jgi:phosphoribosyl 1,2-cyclic phosphodiesterase
VPKVTFYGVRGSCPCSDAGMGRYGGATSCVAVDAGDGMPPVVLDLGTGCRKLGDELLAKYFPCEGPPAGAPPSEPELGAFDESWLADGPSFHRHFRPHARPPARPALEINAFVTHLHFDHVQGLPFFGPALRDDTRVSIYGPRQTGISLGDALSTLVQPPYFPVELDEMPAELCFFEVGDGVVELGDTRVRVREVPHLGVTVGYRVEMGGTSIAYISDHQAPAEDGRVMWTVDDAVLALCDGADLVVHDAQFTDEEFAVRGHWGHSTAAYAVHVAREAGARRLALFHHDPTHDDGALDLVGAETEALATAAGLDELIVAAEGTSIELVTRAAGAVGSPPATL